MKTLIKLAAIIMAVAFTVSAQAQLGTPNQAVRSGIGEWFGTITNSTACNTTNTIIDCTKGKDLYIQYTSILHTSGTAAQSIRLQQSIDKSTWTTFTTIGVAGAGNTTVGLNTNLAVGALPYLRVQWITNAEATATITNYTLKVTVK